MSDMPTMYIENVNSKLNADMFLHLAKPTKLIHKDLTDKVFIVKSNDGLEFKAKIVDYSKARLYEYSNMYLLMATGMEWEKLTDIYNINAEIAMYLMQKIKD